MLITHAIARSKSFALASASQEHLGALIEQHQALVTTGISLSNSRNLEACKGNRWPCSHMLCWGRLHHAGQHIMICMFSYRLQALMLMSYASFWLNAQLMHDMANWLAS